ncbi:MAG: hypothetical protein Q4E35_04955 [Eubacteriales bacterium]|nr:hypothetical protein [Eubacteriales bacterium]
MICKIAGLGVDVPPVGDMPERCKSYLADVHLDIILDRDEMRSDYWEKLSESDNYYLESGFQFYRKLMDFDGMMLHASCVVVDGYAYLFSGPCGMGKSTHTQKYLKTFPDAVIINDDKPALRRIDGKWYAYGTPWCGKDGINDNSSAPVAGICFLHRGDTQINRLAPLQAAGYVLQQTTGRRTPELAKKLMRLVNLLVTEVPVFEFYNHADDGAEMITYNAMRLANDFTL